MKTNKIQAIRTQEMRVVAAIYKYKNLSRAAEELGLTSNYVNVTLLRLEEKLGCTLFSRRQRAGTIVLTKHGMILAPKLKEMADIYLWILENKENIK